MANIPIAHYRINEIELFLLGGRNDFILYNVANAHEEHFSPFGETKTLNSLPEV